MNTNRSATIALLLVMAASLAACSVEEEDPVAADATEPVAGQQTAPPAEQLVERKQDIVVRQTDVEALAAGQAADGEQLPVITMHKTPYCGCCTLWGEHMEAAGFQVEVENHDNLTALKQRLGVPAPLQACHTAVIDDYLVEGHVPASDVLRLLRERPQVAGVAVPGMPLGSPGMEHPQAAAYQSYVFTADGHSEVFSTHEP